MFKSTVSWIMLTLLLALSLLTFAFNIQPVKTERTTCTRWQATIHTSPSYGNQTIHTGDLIIDGNEIFLIENCTYIQTGNVYVRDNASLIIKNTELRLNQTRDWQYVIRVNMSAILEARNATICNHVSPIYSLGIYFLGNSTPLLIDSNLKNVFCYFPSSINIKGNVHVHNSHIDRMVIGWVHNVFINLSRIGTLEFSRGGFLGLRPMIQLISSNIDSLIIGDFGGTLFADEAFISGFRFSGSLYMFGNVTFTQGATISLFGWLKRNFNIICLSNNGHPLEDVNLALYQFGTIIWSGLTDNSGRANFNLTFTNSNYTYGVRLEAMKRDSYVTRYIAFSSETPIMIVLPYSTHELTVTSSPITGIPSTINGTPQTTPYTEWLPEGYYALEMPETYNGYVWSHWLEDGDPNRTKTITLPGTTWTGVFVSIPVGGCSVPIKGYTAEKPSTLYLALIAILTVSFTIAKRRKKQQS